MAIKNYAELKAAIADWMDRRELLDSVTIDKVTIYPVNVFCGHVESECNRKLRTEDMSTVIFNSGCDDQSVVLLPDNVLGLRMITVNGVDAEYLTPEQFSFTGYSGCRGPMYTRIANQLHVYPEMEAASDLTMVAYTAIPPLEKDVDTNWLLRKFPDVYLYGCLYEACAYVYDTDNELKWKQKFNIAIQDLIDSDVDDRWSGSTLSIRHV